MKITKQHDKRDCGATCLSIIASHFGLKHPISKYRELTKTDRNGASLYGLVDAAEKIGLVAEALSGNSDELLNGINSDEIKFPFIAHIITEDNLQHFVVVFSYKNGKFFVADPAKGKKKYTLAKFNSLWTGYIVTFEKSASFKKGNFQKGRFLKFFSLLKGQYNKLALVALISVVISAIGIVGAFVFEIVINDFYSSNDTAVCDDNCEEDHKHVIKYIEEENETGLDKITGFIYDNSSNFNLFFIALVGLYILQMLMHFLRGYLMSLLSKNIDLRLVLPYYDHIIDLSISDVNTRNTGEYMSRFSDTSTIREAVSGAALTLLLDSFMVIACGVILFMENSTLFYISLIVVLIYAIVIICYKKPIETTNRQVMEDNARVQSYLKESIDGVETIKSNQAEIISKEKNLRKFKKLINSVLKNNLITASQDSLCGLAELVGIAVILWVGFGMVLNDVITVGSLITFYALLSYFTEPIKNLIALQPTIQTAIVAADRLNDILEIQTEPTTQNTKTEFEWSSIAFSNIDFRYGNHELALKDVSLNIKKGEKIAIIGESGCGKTTLAKLLLKFYSPENGTITFNNNNLADIAIFDVRRKIAYIDQNTFLFSDTVKNNLILGNDNITDKEIIDICKLTMADDFIQALPFGYDTFLEENGKNLSGGQRQRLAIARALLRKPEILILDEATSNLDTITENAIKNTIFNLSQNITCIIIAHRLSTIKNCDKIYVMNNGTIAESGTHDELINHNGLYKKFYAESK